MTKVPKVPKLTHTVKVSEKNFKRLWSLAGRLQEKKGVNQSPDDAVNYLFRNQKGKDSERARKEQNTPTERDN